MRQYKLEDLNKLNKGEVSFLSSDSVPFCRDSTCAVEGCQENQKTAAAIKQGATFVLGSEAKKLKTDNETLRSAIAEGSNLNAWQASEIRKLRDALVESKKANAQQAIDLDQARRTVPAAGRTDIVPVYKRDTLYGCPTVFHINGLPVDGIVGQSASRATIEITVDALSNLLESSAVKTKQIRDLCDRNDTQVKGLVAVRAAIGSLETDYNRLPGNVADAILSRDNTIVQLREKNKDLEICNARQCDTIRNYRDETVARSLAEFKARGDVNRARRIDELNAILNDVLSIEDTYRKAPIKTNRTGYGHDFWREWLAASEALFNIKLLIQNKK